MVLFTVHICIIAAVGLLLDLATLNLSKYCCPVNFKTAEESSPKPFRIGLRAFFFEKQAPPNQIMMVPAVGI